MQQQRQHSTRHSFISIPEDDTRKVSGHGHFFQDFVAFLGLGLVVLAIEVVNPKGQGQTPIGFVVEWFVVLVLDPDQSAIAMIVVAASAIFVALAICAATRADFVINHSLQGLDRERFLSFYLVVAVVAAIVVTLLWRQPNGQANGRRWIGLFLAPIGGLPAGKGSHNGPGSGGIGNGDVNVGNSPVALQPFFLCRDCR